MGRILWAFFVCMFLKSIMALNIVNIILGGNPAYEYTLSGPAYQAALEDALVECPKMGSNVTAYSVVRRGRSKTCEEEALIIYDAFGEIYELLNNLSGPVIMQTPGMAWVKQS